MEAALGRALRPLRIVPCVLCVDGSTRAVAPLPPQMSLVGEGKESLEVPLEYREGGDGDGDGEEGGGGGEAAAVTLAASSARFCVLKVAATADTEALESPMQVWPDDDGSLVARPALRPTARPFLLKLVCEAATPPHAPLPSAELRVLASARRTARCTLPVEQCAKADAKGVIELRWEGHVEDILVDEGGTMRRIGAWGDALSATAEGLVKFAPVTVRVGPAAIAAAKNATFIPATTATEKAPAKATTKATGGREGGTGAGEGDGAHSSGHRHRAARARRRRGAGPRRRPARARRRARPAPAAAAPPEPAAAAPEPEPAAAAPSGTAAEALDTLDGGGDGAAALPLPEAQLRALSVDGIKRLLESNGFDDDSTRARMSAAVSLKRASYSTAKLDPLEGYVALAIKHGIAVADPTAAPAATRRQAHRPARRSAGVGAPRRPQVGRRTAGGEARARHAGGGGAGRTRGR